MHVCKLIFVNQCLKDIVVNRFVKLLIVTVAVLLVGCETKKDREPSKRPEKKQIDFFKVEYELKPYKLGERILIEFTNLDTKNTIDSVQIISGNHVFSTLKKLRVFLSTKDLLLGQNSYSFKVYFSDKSTQVKTRSIEIWAIKGPESLSYEVVNTYAHNVESYTQGLQYHDGFLYEGTGQFGESSIQKINIKDGGALLTRDLPPHQFGEGITIVDDKVYQLTWKSVSGYVYSLDSLQEIQSFYYPHNVEGWGLTYDGRKLIISDGTDRLFFWNEPELTSHHFITVGDNEKTYRNINELEYVDGFIYANIYLGNDILKIDAETGVVVAVIDFSSILSEEDKMSLEDPHGEVLNGIAYNPASQTFYITGKDWPKLFEVKLF